LVDIAAIEAGLVEHWQYEGLDYDRSHRIYREDAVLEFPQSGERFIGLGAFLSWRRQYPAALDFRIRRITHDGDLWVTENLISYDGGPYKFTVNILTFRGDRIAHEALYVMDGFDAAPWRAAWATPFDPLASVAAGAWRHGESTGIGDGRTQPR
jgi:hypothetical protein